ncbi:MAG: UDP-N-acetylmuramoyl-L-alanine--D-glutamate ligase [Candidatus Omnitrophota bacterium]|nr:UDP-N-acetylmuramoyl-L-alanine--D-glutamate ligase [Candidatus Omnitrophota bacterium]
MIDLKNKKILILGLGVSGYAAALFLLKKGFSVKVSEKAGEEDIGGRIKELGRYGQFEYETRGHTGEFCSKADVAVISPGVHTKELYDAGVLPVGMPAIGTLELGYMYCVSTVVAVTGTNGKSTVTELIGHMINASGRKAVVCGNIGNPLIGEVAGLSPRDIAVVEVSSFQLGTIDSFRPHIAVLLNITEDHYDRHRGYEDYRSEKFKIFANQNGDDWAVINASFKGDEEIGRIKSGIVYFGKGKHRAEVSQKEVSINDESGANCFSIKEKDLSLSGIHNMENVACAAIVGWILGISAEVLVSAAASFRPLKHRTEKVGVYEGICFIDDSKATNIDATRRAVESTDGKIILIAGGRDKGGDYRSLTSLIKEKVKAVIVIGEAQTLIKEAFGGVVPVICSANMADAVRVSAERASRGDIIMLSPMCSSFDMFSGYRERGDVFQREVKKQAGKDMSA